jgi:hypothetical protein
MCCCAAVAASGDRCDWQWKFYQDSWLRSSSGRAVSTVETWYGLEDFEIQTTPGGTAHSVLDGYTFGTSSTAGVPVFAPTVAALRSVLAYVCSKKGAELREDRNVAEIPLQSLQQGRLRRGSELYTGDGEEIAGLLGSIQGASECECCAVDKQACKHIPVALSELWSGRGAASVAMGPLKLLLALAAVEQPPQPCWQEGSTGSMRALLAQ